MTLDGNVLEAEWLRQENESLRARVAELEQSLEVFRRAADESEQRSLVKELREDVAEDGKTIEALRARVAELEAHNKRMWDFICSLDGMNAGHMHDGAIDDEIAIVASDFKG